LKAADLVISSGYRSAGSSAPTCHRTVLLRFPTDREAAWDSLKGKSRNLIRKAEHAGLELTWGAAGLRVLHRIHSTVMAARGVPAPSLGYLEAMQAALGDRMGVLVASADGEAVGGTVVLFGEQVALYPYQAVTPTGQRMAASQLMIWGIVQACVLRGVATIDMGESREGSPTFRFKTNFGGTPADLHYYRPGRLSGADQAAPAAPPAWSRLPNPLRRRAAVMLHRRGRVA